MSNIKNFPEGLRFSSPSEKAPEWVKGQISVNVAKFLPWAEANQDERGWINLDLKVSKNGNYYLELNEWRKDKTGQKRTIEKPTPVKSIHVRVEDEEGSETEEELPF